MTAGQRLVRRISLTLLVLWLAGLVVAFVRHQLRREPPATTVGFEPGAQAGGEKPIRVHTGFGWLYTLGVEPSFRVAAREAVEFSSGWYELHDVEFSLYHRGEVTYGLTAEKARLNQAKGAAEVSGSAQLSLQGGMAVRADGFTLHGPERTVESRGPVSFAGPGLGGVAGGLVCSLADDSLEVTGGVSATWQQAGSSVPPLVLLAPRLRYERRNALASFPDGLTILRAGLRTEAAAAELHLEADNRTLRTATFTGPVMVDGTPEGGGAVDGHAGTTLVQAIGSGRYSVTAGPDPALGWVRMRWLSPGEGWRELAAWRLVGEGTEGSWDWLEGQGLACADEFPPDADPRHVTAQRIRLVFASGQPVTALASDDVRVESADRWAQGGELTLSLATKRFTLLPAEGERVISGGAEGESQSDRIDGDELGKVVANGDVTGVAKRGSVMGGSRGPVHFAASRVQAGQRESRIVLEGDARLWQGDRLIRADRIEYDQDREQVQARGGVLTTAKTGEAGGEAGDVEVRARALDYDRLAGTAIYEGDVTMEDRQATSSCQRLVVDLGDKGEVLQATLTGGVTVNEKATKRTLTGQRAVLRPPTDLFEIWGNPVVAREPSGNEIKGNHLEWHRETGTVVVVGGEANPSETLYHPAKPLPTRRPSRPGAAPRVPGGRRP